MTKREAQFGLLFRHWIKANPRLSGAFELKQSSGAMPFSDVADHQIDALLAAKYDGLLYKAPDDSRGLKPFDYFYLRNCPAYIVIRYPSCFVLIDVDTFMIEKKRSARKSLTEGRAKEISTVTVALRDKVR